MKKTFLLAALFLAATAVPGGEGAKAAALSEREAAGKEIAFRNKGDAGVGNCLACHAIAGADSPGDMGPPLAGMKQRFPDRELLRRRLHDATQFNPISAMPPFGKHRILTADEIDLLVDFLYTL